MDRRFQKVFLKVPNIEETYAIMKALRPGLEEHHNLTISDDNLMLIIHLTEEHMPQAKPAGQINYYGRCRTGLSRYESWH